VRAVGADALGEQRKEQPRRDAEGQDDTAVRPVFAGKPPDVPSST
jgi:hypothetical protein